MRNINSKKYINEQKKEGKMLEQEKDREKVELDIKKTKSLKENLQKLCS